MILIGLGNKARHGKDSVAHFMQEAIPEIKLYSFASILKQFCLNNHESLIKLWELTHPNRVLNAPKVDRIYGYTDILQFVGTDIVRHIYLNAWVDALTYSMSIDSPEIAAITDVRFPNEAKFIKDNGGFLIHVSRYNEDGSPYFDPNRDKNHVSETALDDYNWDFYIAAKTGDMNGLKVKSLTVLKDILSDVAGTLYDASKPIKFVRRK